MRQRGPRLLLVDQGDYTAKRDLPRRLVDLGYRLTLVQWTSSVWHRELFEQVVTSRLTNWSYLADTLRAEHAREPFSGVLCYNEGAVPTANDIARLLALPQVSRYDSESFRYKDRMRVAWEAAGIPVPRFKILHGPADARVLGTWRFPIVLKPTAIMGSIGVVKVDRAGDLPRLVPRVLGADLDIALDGELWTMSEAFNLPRQALAEQYLPGDEYSAEGLVAGGDYHLLGVTRKVLTDEPWFDEVGHVFPTADLSGSALARLVELLKGAHAALGMDNAVTHTEFRVSHGRFMLIELNARIAGDHIPALVQEALGLDVVALAARCACGSLAVGELAALGELPSRRGPAGAPVAAVAFLTSPPEAHGRRLVKLRLPAPDQACSVVSSTVYLEPGDVIPIPSEGRTSRIGHAIFTAPDQAAALRAVETARQDVEVVHADP